MGIQQIKLATERFAEHTVIAIMKHTGFLLNVLKSGVTSSNFKGYIKKQITS